MSLVAKRIPLLSIRVFDVWDGDPRVTAQGFGWYDVLQESAVYGSSNFDSSGRPKCELLQGIGLTLRPQLVLQDTRLSHYSTSGGNWNELKPGTGAPKVYRLVQNDNVTAGAYSATSTFSVPADPHCALELLIPDTPPDWNAATYPPYVQVELGGGTWALRYDAEGGWLLRKVSGSWQRVIELPRPATAAYGQPEGTAVVYVRVYLGRIGISTDFGASYVWTPWQGPGTVIPAGTLTVRGQGGALVFGLHQLAYSTGIYTSQTRATLTSRSTPTLTLTARGDEPGSTSVVLADASTPLSGLAAYTATLTPATQSALPFSFHYAPVLRAVQFVYAPATSAGAGTYATPFDAAGLLGCTVTEPPVLHAGSAEWEWEVPAGQTWSDAGWRRRKVQIRMGWRENGVDSWWTVFTGYVRQTIPSMRDGKVTVRFVADNATAALKLHPWDRFQNYALGGQSLNSAADFILATEGLNASYRAWDGLGDLFTLPAGAAENPCELCRPGERKWETLQRLCGYAGMEPYALRDGTFASVGRTYYGAKTHEYRVTDPADIDELPTALAESVDYNQSASAVMVTGVGEFGQLLLAWARDAYAETDSTADRAVPWQEVQEEELPGTVTQGLANARAQALAYDLFRLKREPEITASLNLDVLRRDQVEIYGAEAMGIADGTAYYVVSLQHHFQPNLETGDAELTTTAALARV